MEQDVYTKKEVDKIIKELSDKIKVQDEYIYAARQDIAALNEKFNFLSNIVKDRS